MTHKTSELRRILKERGIGYEAPRDGLTIGRTDTTTYSFYESLAEPEHGMFATATTEWLEPEQLIDATLGKRDTREPKG